MGKRKQYRVEIWNNDKILKVVEGIVVVDTKYYTAIRINESIEPIE